MKIIVLCSLDAFANSVKPTKILEYFSTVNSEVELFSTFNLSRMSNEGFLKKIPAINLLKISLFVYELLNFATRKADNIKLFKFFNSYLVVPTIRARGRVLRYEMNKKKPDVIICENSIDLGFLEGSRVANVQILDLPSPAAEELKYSNKLTNNGYKKLNNYEVHMYGRADYISFHWHTYTDYVKKNKYNGANLFEMGYGVDKKNKIAKYSDRPRIIFMGQLSGEWVNLPLLAELCSKYPNIDVYGGPEPHKKLGINYKGYAPTKDLMADYQFGLVTISKDPLRKNSFSSKQIEYMSYGLPVLTPSWRKDKSLAEGSIYFSSTDEFGEAISNFLGAEEWSKKSKASVKTSVKFTWGRAFKELKLIIEDLA
jgi:hypothetical protein